MTARSACPTWSASDTARVVSLAYLTDSGRTSRMELVRAGGLPGPSRGPRPCVRDGRGRGGRSESLAHFRRGRRPAEPSRTGRSVRHPGNVGPAQTVTAAYSGQDMLLPRALPSSSPADAGGHLETAAGLESGVGRLLEAADTVRAAPRPACPGAGTPTFPAPGSRALRTRPEATRPPGRPLPAVDVHCRRPP